MAKLNHVIVDGNVVRNYAGPGDTRPLVIAVDRDYYDKDKSEWVKRDAMFLTVWNVKRELNQGDYVVVQGSLDVKITELDEKKFTNVSITSQRLILLKSKKEEANAQPF